MSDDTWTWIAGHSTFSTANGIYGTLKIPSETNYPGARVGGLTWVDFSNNLWLFGGSGIDSESGGSGQGTEVDLFPYVNTMSCFHI